MSDPFYTEFLLFLHYSCHLNYPYDVHFITKSVAFV